MHKIASSSNQQLGLKIKTLFFLGSNFGGAERMTIHIANCLEDDKYDVIFYVIGKDLGAIEGFLPASKKRILLKAKSFQDSVTLKLINVLNTEKPDIVFSSLFPINARLCIACMLFPKVKVIIRSDNYLYTQSLPQKIRLFFAYRFLDFLITQTDEMKDEYVNTLRLKEMRVATFSNPVDKEAIDKKISGSISPFNDNDTNYVFVGRIAKVKGLDVLLPAFSKLLNENPNSRLYIIGETDGYYKEYYETLLILAEQLKIKEHIVFVGFSHNPYNYMKYADCLVLPSRNEGLPNVIIEALYLGTPVAVTNCIPVIKRIVRENVDGFVTEVDDVEGLASAMKSASTLDRVTSTYISATKEDFQQLFKSIASTN